MGNGETEFIMSSKDKTIDQRSTRPARKQHGNDARTAKLHGSILVVDDSKEGREVISRVLRCVGLDVETAENGQVACERALAAVEQRRPFDLILMDVSMPVMDGCEATVHLREHGYSGRIAAFTANAEARETCLMAGCDDFAAKPISFEMLFDLAERNL
jgi:CheY-like chemotaxis protein